MSDKTKELPAHIGGYQKLEPWVIVEEGDIWVQFGKPISFVYNEQIGSTVIDNESRYAGRDPVGDWHTWDGTGIYRKMTTPRNHCEVDWEKASEEIKERQIRHFFAGVQLHRDKAKTDDASKPPLAHLPWGALDEVAMVQSYGHQKYGDFYNYKKGMEVSRNISCAIRHLRAYMNGEDNDHESSRPHLAHAACRILFALQNIKDGKAIDDRFKP